MKKRNPMEKTNARIHEMLDVLKENDIAHGMTPQKLRRHWEIRLILSSWLNRCGQQLSRRWTF